MSTEFVISKMTRVEAAPDGTAVRLSMNDVTGQSVSLVLLFDCLS